MNALPGLGLDSAATLSADGRYRYDLTRRWGDGPLALWVMLNPSTADADTDDPTIRRCIGFSKREGCGGLVVVNRFAYRATDPSELIDIDDAEGPDNTDVILRWFDHPDVRLRILAWGAWLDDHRRAMRGTSLVASTLTFAPGSGTMRCLGRTKGGAPRHPLYVRSDQGLEDW